MHSPFPPQASSREGEEEEEEEGMGEPEPSCIAQGSVHANNGQVSAAAAAAAASALGASVSFGRFLSEPLDWGKWSSFCQKRCLEEAAKHSTPGSVAQKKAFFEARHEKKLATELEQLDVDRENQKSTGNLMELTKPFPDKKPLEEIYVDDQNGSGSNIEKNRGESTTPIRHGKKNKSLVNLSRSRAGSTTPLSNKRSPVMKKASSNGVSKFASLTPHSQHGRIGSPLKQTPSTRKQVDVKMPSIGYSNLSSIKGHRAEIEVASPSNSFKTNGKVEKKKEFFSNLENKVVRKEVRKLQLQGAPKEISGNRIKELSRSLCFKARPLPDFYRNTGLAKHEAKKTPLQRPQSPQSKEQPQSKTKTKLSSVNAGSRKWQ